jgi:hypothetical protein
MLPVGLAYFIMAWAGVVGREVGGGWGYDAGTAIVVAAADRGGGVIGG